jgi:hypothetical protein
METIEVDNKVLATSVIYQVLKVQTIMKVKSKSSKLSGSWFLKYIRKPYGKFKLFIMISK